MGDKKAVIKIGADVWEAKDGIDKITRQLNDLQKSVKQNSFVRLAEGVASAGKAFGFAADVAKKINESIKENIELAKK